MKNLEILKITNLITEMILDKESLFERYNIRIYSNNNNLFIENYPLYLTKISFLIDILDTTKYTFEIENNIIRIF